MYITIKSMIENIFEGQGNGDFTWVDVSDPSAEDFKKLAVTYSLPQIAINDCLDPKHLPKYERIGNVHFIIVRFMDEKASNKSSSMVKMTRKIAIFVGENWIVTIHRKPILFVKTIRDERAKKDSNVKYSKNKLLLDILLHAINTYEHPIQDCEQIIERYEASAFHQHSGENTLKIIYVLKNRISIIKRMLMNTKDLGTKLSIFAEPNPAEFQNFRERIDSLFFFADETLEEVSDLLNFYVSMFSQRTNEVMRVLTLFSAFFMPLTFIVGVYGMNFQYMPELTQPWGYPLVLFLMASLSLGIYFWFRKKGWL